MHAWWACCVRACMVGRPPWSSFSGHATRPRWPTLHPRYLRPQKAPRDVRHMFGHQREQAQHAGWIPDFLLEFLKIWLASSASTPILNTYQFMARGVESNQVRDVIIHCNGQHFTLMRPHDTEGSRRRGSVVSQLIFEARERGCIVQEHSTDVRPGHSLASIFRKIKQHSVL